MDLLDAINDAAALEDPGGALEMLGFDQVEVYVAAAAFADKLIEHFRAHDVTVHVEAGPGCDWNNVTDRATLQATIVLGMVGGIMAQREKAAETDETEDPRW